MGLHGSSTTPLVLQDVRVPSENLLGEVGKGHKVAFNVLNFGRFKLGAMCTGGARTAIAQSAKYAAARRQFGRPIADFGAIKHKIGEMVARTYALESLLYRTVGLIEQWTGRVAASNPADGAALLAALEEFAVEASIAKAKGGEISRTATQRCIAILGSMGISQEFLLEKWFRDCRITDIYEGTGQIQRLIIAREILGYSAAQLS